MMDPMSILRQSCPLWLGSIFMFMGPWMKMASMKVLYYTHQHQCFHKMF